MRVLVSRYLRVRVGDDVLIRANLPARAKLARLHVFAKAWQDDRMSPYVHGVATIVEASVVSGPQMATPLMLRLTEQQPVRKLRFKSDIDGAVCIMQEVDARHDPRARIAFTRNPDWPWHKRVLDNLWGWLPSWSMTLSHR